MLFDIIQYNLIYGVYKMGLNTRDNPNEILEKILEHHGIGVIREFMNGYNKKARKKQTRVNKYEEIALNVYNLMYTEYFDEDLGYLDNYDKTRAIAKVADEKSLTYNTVRNHCAKFDKEAKEFDYYSFGSLIEEKGLHYINIFAKENNISSEFANIYYKKYLNFNGKKEKLIIDTSKFKVPRYQQQQPYKQSLTDDDISF